MGLASFNPSYSPFTRSPIMKFLTFFTMLLFMSPAFAASETKEFDTRGLQKLVVRTTAGNVKISEAKSSKAVVKIDKVKFSDHCTMTVERIDEQLVITVEKANFFSFSDCEVNFE